DGDTLVLKDIRFHVKSEGNNNDSSEIEEYIQAIGGGPYTRKATAGLTTHSPPVFSSKKLPTQQHNRPPATTPHQHPPPPPPPTAAPYSCPRSAWRASSGSRPPASCSSAPAASVRRWASTSPPRASAASA